MRRAGYSGHVVVAGLVVTIVASHRTHAQIIGSANDGRDMDSAPISLQGRMKLMAI